MDVKVEILGRYATDVPFAVLGMETVALTGDKVIFTPTIPPAAVEKELRVRVSASNSIIFRTGRFIDPATRPGPTPHFDGNGVQTGMDPAPTPTFSEIYSVWGGKVTEGVPFNSPFGSVVIGNPGVDLRS